MARGISLIEDEAADAAALIGQIYPRTGRAYLIGITGANPVMTPERARPLRQRPPPQPLPDTGEEAMDPLS